MTPTTDRTARARALALAILAPLFLTGAQPVERDAQPLVQVELIPNEVECGSMYCMLLPLEETEDGRTWVRLVYDYDMQGCGVSVTSINSDGGKTTSVPDAQEGAVRGVCWGGGEWSNVFSVTNGDPLLTWRISEP